jgi:putative tryptophan/tyrosine transport system substrate-binding protein
MRRRKFIALLGSSAVAWPLTASGQQTGKIYRIGFVANDPTIPTQLAGQAFLDGLRENGFIEGKNIVIEQRFAEARLDRYAELVAELIRLEVDVLVTSAEEATVAAKRATTKIPIVMLNISDPVGQGIVASSAHPGGNITGVIQDDSPEIAAKRMQFLKDAIPRVANVALLTDSDLSYRQVEWQALALAARSLNVMLRRFVVRQTNELERAFAAIETDRPDALFLTPPRSILYTANPLLSLQRKAACRRWPHSESIQKAAASCLMETSGLTASGAQRSTLPKS